MTDRQAGMANGVAHSTADCMSGSIRAKAAADQRSLTRPTGRASVSDEMPENLVKSSSH